MSEPTKARLTQPLVRENGAHRPATWDEAMNRVAEAFRKVHREERPAKLWHVQLLQDRQRIELCGAEIRPQHHGHEQH